MQNSLPATSWVTVDIPVGPLRHWISIKPEPPIDREAERVEVDSMVSRGLIRTGLLMEFKSGGLYLVGHNEQVDLPDFTPRAIITRYCYIDFESMKSSPLPKA